ncbi:flagellar motor switch protein FliG [Marinilactibacillus psychrotolerans]|uniref:Flagellar motor switch protein FliG n=1 Tax=Marinilactibacillus psychrotolerans TaxID=191770 RepID=A0A511GY72_9LACT|nr:flagellar motor switch protein FliG [Marinilactibacillus psychrotolerans]TLQ09359.1 flagellar motor switch protein FliG [Marinilactibacillus psychrotolerans]GEL66207.1 flagellar motor switch protein FliG [Marinilactibacillus psychrotolerans]GEQ35050.1 flagellar motor switch protein, FliG [Marinilactibacillus psychrotolerans]SDC27336.1 flagellar motor switch protein FliG [Marinilactibacillus psychrotolerans]
MADIKEESKASKLDGIKKAAIFMIALGPETSAQIMKQLPDAYIQKVSYEIANIDHVSQQDREMIIDEFLEMSQAREYILDGGIDYAKTLLNKALGTQRAKEVIDMLNQIQLRERPFNIARKADPQQLTNLLLGEQSQTVALILCYMQPDKAAQILVQFPAERQTDIAERIGTISSTSPAVIERIEKVIESKFSSYVENETESVGGVHTLVDILNQVGRTTEKTIVSELEETQPALAEEIKASLFTFEDIVSLQKADVQKVLREVNQDDLILALKGVSDELRDFIFENLSARAVDTLKEDMQFLGPARLSAVEEAQQKIVTVIRRLDEQGEVYIMRGEQDAIVE